jgi:hypothetical protein
MCELRLQFELLPVTKNMVKCLSDPRKSTFYVLVAKQVDTFVFDFVLKKNIFFCFALFPCEKQQMSFVGRQALVPNTPCYNKLCSKKHYYDKLCST